MQSHVCLPRILERGATSSTSYMHKLPVFPLSHCPCNRSPLAPWPTQCISLRVAARRRMTSWPLQTRWVGTMASPPLGRSPPLAAACGPRAARSAAKQHFRRSWLVAKGMQLVLNIPTCAISNLPLVTDWKILHSRAPYPYSPSPTHWRGMTLLRRTAAPTPCSPPPRATPPGRASSPRATRSDRDLHLFKSELPALPAIQRHLLSLLL